MTAVQAQYAAPVTRFTGRYAFLSMFHPCPVVYEDITYPGGEWAFQAAKTADLALRARILTMETGGRAKAYGRSLPLRPDWEAVKRPVMLAVCLDKFTRSPDLGAVLAATGSAVLVEGNHWGDDIWGAVPGSPRRAGLPVWTGPDGTLYHGENWLGRILMMVREVLAG